MNYTKYGCLLILSMISCRDLVSISMVYNFRIAQITKQPIFEKPNGKSHTIVGLFFDQFRRKYTGVKQNFVGGLGSFIYDFGPYYFRTDAAVSHIVERADHITTFSGTETDDILFTFGRNLMKNDRNVVTLSGLFGIPTHKLLRLKHVDFGYSLVGIGAQLDGSYTLNHTNFLLYGMRYIYFVPRKGLDTVGEKHIFTLGNISDFLLAYKNNWNLHHGVEFGYTSRYRYGARISPNLDEIVQKANYIRSNFYGVYKYKFSINNVSNRLLFYAAYGLDHLPQTFGNKYIVTLWTSWNISF